MCHLSHCWILLDNDVVLLLVVVKAKAVAGAKSHQLPLRMQRQCSDYSRRLALDQGEGLEARREHHRLIPHVQTSVTLVNKRITDTNGINVVMWSSFVVILQRWTSLTFHRKPSWPCSRSTTLASTVCSAASSLSSRTRIWKHNSTRFVREMYLQMIVPKPEISSLTFKPQYLSHLSSRASNSQITTVFT